MKEFDLYYWTKDTQTYAEQYYIVNMLYLYIIMKQETVKNGVVWSFYHLGLQIHVVVFYPLLSRVLRYTLNCLCLFDLL